MTGKERFKKIFNGEIPDRVPVTLFIVEQGHFITQIYPDIDPYDYKTMQLKVIEFQKEIGCDVFVRLVFGANDPISIHYGGLKTDVQTENWQVKTKQKKSGDTRIYHSEIITPDGLLTQDFSAYQLRPGTFMYSCTLPPIKSEKDLDIAIKYEPGMDPGYPQKLKAWLEDIKNAVKDSGIIGAWSPHGPFNNASMLINQSDLYSLYLVNPGFYDKLMNFAMQRVLPYALAIEEAGVDVHCVGGNVPGGFLGSNIYDNYILPYEKKYIDILQQNGTPAMYHNCGEIMNLVESYKKLGAKIIEPFSPHPLGDTDLKQVKEQVNNEYVILGGVDQINVIQKGTVEQVRKVTNETMRVGKPGGNFIIQSADFLEYGTPLENVKAFVQTALDNAWY
jgi:uroporphyrinogen decarboxylase